MEKEKIEEYSRTAAMSLNVKGEIFSMLSKDEQDVELKRTIKLLTIDGRWYLDSLWVELQKLIAKEDFLSLIRKKEGAF